MARQFLCYDLIRIGPATVLSKLDQYSHNVMCMPKKKLPRTAKKESRKREAPRIDVRLPQALYKQIQDLIKDGQFFNMSEFGRTAIREKLATLQLSRKK